MATTFIEPGGDSDFGIGLWPSSFASPTVATDFVHGGHQKSLKYGINAFDQVIANSVVQDSGARISLWIYINALPSSVGVPIVIDQANGANNVIAFTLTPAGVIQINDNNSVQMGTNGATLTTGQWYRISIAYVITSSTVNTFKVWVNGVISNNISNYSLPTVTSNELVVGNASGDTTFDFRSSDHYVDNSSALTDPGNIWVTAKRPFSNGTTIGFTTRIGAGGSGYGSGHTPQVNERPNSDTNGWSVAAAGSAITEEYNIEGQAVGDINITGSTIIDYMGWVRSKALVSETGKIIVNGVSSNIALTSTIAFFTKIAGSTTYPAGTGSDIGEISATTATTVSLYECGIIVAYIPAVVTATFSLGSKSLLGVGK